MNKSTSPKHTYKDAHVGHKAATSDMVMNTARSHATLAVGESHACYSPRIQRAGNNDFKWLALVAFS